VLVLRRRLRDQVDLVLQDDDVLEPHDLNGCKVLAGLGGGGLVWFGGVPEWLGLRVRLVDLGGGVSPGVVGGVLKV